MKALLTLAIALTCITALHADDKADASKVVNSFYDTYIAAMIKQQNGEKLMQKSPQLSPAFKKVHGALVAKAWKENPELGLGYDAIVCGQDFPDAGFAVTSITLKDTKGTAVVSSKDKEFKHTIPIKLVKIDGKWLINAIDKLEGK